MRNRLFHVLSLILLLLSNAAHAQPASTAGTPAIAVAASGPTAGFAFMACGDALVVTGAEWGQMLELNKTVQASIPDRTPGDRHGRNYEHVGSGHAGTVCRLACSALCPPWHAGTPKSGDVFPAWIHGVHGLPACSAVRRAVLLSQARSGASRLPSGAVAYQLSREQSGSEKLPPIFAFALSAQSAQSASSVAKSF